MDQFHKDRRARRIARTLVIARRRREEHLVNHYNDTTGLTEVDCVCELSNTMFSKRSAFACGCSKKKKGAPRAAVSTCKYGERHRVYRWRVEARQLRAAARAGRVVGSSPMEPELVSEVEPHVEEANCIGPEVAPEASGFAPGWERAA